MPFLADTNILLRVLQRGDPDHAVIRAALRKLKLRGETIHYLSQNLAEFWRCSSPRRLEPELREPFHGGAFPFFLQWSLQWGRKLFPRRLVSGLQA